jgi:hypothetical protein
VQSKQLRVDNASASWSKAPFGKGGRNEFFSLLMLA